VISPLARLGVDPVLARHVRGALAFYRAQLEQGGFAEPAGLDALIEFTSLVVDRSGQLHPLRAATSEDGSREFHGHLLAVEDAAAVASVSTKTLRRRITDGSVRDVRVGRRQFIEAGELLRFLSSDEEAS
jgi:hypothetical protein